MDYRMDFLSSREKDSLYAKYGTYPGWHSSQTYEHSPSKAAYLQYLSDYGEPNTRAALGARNNLDNLQTETSSTTSVSSQSKLSHRELYDYIDGVRNLVPAEKQKSDISNYKEQDIYAHCEGWESTWQTNWRGKTDEVGSNSHQELQAYINRYHHTLPQKTPGFEAGDWRSSRSSSDFEKLLGCGQCAETRSQPTSVSSHKKDHSDREIEHWSKWSPWDSRNMKSLFPVQSFRQPPSYMAPPAYSSPKDGYKLAGIPKVSGQAFPEQTFENRNVKFTEMRRNPSANNGQCLQNNNQTQNTERYYSEITGGQKPTVSVMQYTAIKTRPSPHTNLQYPESTQMTYCDSTQMKKTKPLRRKGGETVFCLVSRMGEVSGLSSSPEEPLKSHVLPLLSDIKSNNGSVATKQTSSPQRNDDSRQNQHEYLKRNEPESGCFMFREHGNTVLGHNREDQQSNYIQDLSNVVNPDKNVQDLQWIDSWSGCLTQKSSMQIDSHEKPCREIIDKFPLWKEPKYQSHSTDINEEPNRQHQDIINKSNFTNIEDNDNATNDQSLVIIDATCVVVKVELVYLPEKEHVQYVCLTEEGPFSSTSEGNDDQKQDSGVLSSKESPENSTVDARAKGMIEGADEHHSTGKGVLDETDSSWDSYAVSHIKEFDKTTVEAREVLENEMMMGQLGDGTTLQGNNSLEVMVNIMRAEDQATAKPEDLVLINAEPTSEDCEDTTETLKHTKEIKEQENRPMLDESDCVNAETEQDENIHQQDAPKDFAKGKTEDSLSDEMDGQEEHDLDNSTTLNSNKIVLPSTVGKGTIRRSSSSPHLSIYSSELETPVISHSEDESWLLSSSTNTEDSQCSVSPSVRSSRTNSLYSLPSSPIPDVVHNSSLPQTRIEPDDVLLCTSLPSEHNIKIQHAKSLRDAVSRIRKHTAPDSETEDEEVDECGDQTEGLSGVYKHTVPDSETEEETVNEAEDQTKGVNFICKHTVPDSETEEEEMNDQIEEVNGFHEHTAPDSKAEEDELNDSRDKTEEVNCLYKHIAPDSETEAEEMGESDEQIDGISCIHKHIAFYSETDEVHESGDQTEDVICICKHTAHVSKEEVEEVNGSGDQTEGVGHICKHTAPVSEEDLVNWSDEQTEKVHCVCKYSATESKTEEEEVGERGDQPEGESTDSLYQSLNEEDDFEKLTKATSVSSLVEGNTECELLLL